MERRSALVIVGTVFSGSAQTPLAGVVVTARAPGARRGGARGATNALGEFDLTLPLGALQLQSARRLQFTVSREGEKTPFHTAKAIPLAKLGPDPMRG